LALQIISRKPDYIMAECIPGGAAFDYSGDEFHAETQRRAEKTEKKEAQIVGLNFSAVLFGLCVKSGTFHMADAQPILAPLQIPQCR
jgi:hypothetical protein